MSGTTDELFADLARGVVSSTFSGLEEDEAVALVGAGRLERLAAGDRLETDEGEDPVLVVRGCLGRGLVSAEGRIYLPQPLLRGAVIGEANHLTDLRILPTKTEERRIHALMPSLVLHVPSERYVTWKEDPGFLRAGLRRTAELEAWTRRYLVYHAIIEKDVVLARCLCMLGDSLGRPVMGSFELAIRQDDLARHACLTRRHVNSLLGKWAEEGIVETAKGRVIIVDTARLLEAAGIRDISTLRGDPDAEYRLELED